MLIIPDLFTPWIEGREAAINANWNDLLKYNQVQGGQLQNLESLGTLDANINRAYEDLNRVALDNDYNAMTLDARAAQQMYKAQQDAYNTRQAARMDSYYQNMQPGVEARAQALSQTQQQYALPTEQNRALSTLSGLDAARAQALYTQDYMNRARATLSDPQHPVNQTPMSQQRILEQQAEQQRALQQQALQQAQQAQRQPSSPGNPITVPNSAAAPLGLPQIIQRPAQQRGNRPEDYQVRMRVVPPSQASQAPVQTPAQSAAQSAVSAPSPAQTPARPSAVPATPTPVQATPPGTPQASLSSEDQVLAEKLASLPIGGYMLHQGNIIIRNDAGELVTIPTASTINLA